MNPSDGGRSEGRRRPRAAGFPEFSMDPFFGGGPMGRMMGGSSFFDDFFGRDPFEDPFFTRPLGMGMLGGNIFGRGPMGMDIGMNMNSFFDRSGFFARPDGSLMNQQQLRPPPPQLESRRRGPVIEELTDEAEETTDDKAENEQHPVIEHPEDDEGTGSTSHETRAVSNRRPYQSNNNASQSNNTVQSFSFQSSSMSFGGSGSSYYSSSSMRRVGPDGVVQEEHVEKDSSGKETRTSARGLKDQVHAITKKRSASSCPESTIETLHNLTPEEAPHFDAQWEARAERSLPAWNRGGTQALEGNHSRPHRQVPPALRYHDDGPQSRMSRS